MQFTEHAGLSTLASINDQDYERRMLSDGNQILLNYYGGQAYLLRDHVVTGMSMTTGQDNARYMEFTIRSYGPVTSVPFSKAAAHFQSAHKLDVDELLKIVYNKMEERAEEKT
jgi:hypothetical protein